LDVERLPDDPLEKIGQERIYTQFGEYQREVSAGEEARLKRLYELFQEKLVANLTPDSLLVDCHSFPSELSDDIDVCIGYNNDWSQPPQDVIDYIVKRFSEASFNVAVNTPYSNSITPKCDFIIIQLNKRTYWDEHKMQMTDGAIKLHGMLLSLYVNLLCGFIGDK
jgi:N-formylglutamate amidohydrolase